MITKQIEKILNALERDFEESHSAQILPRQISYAMLLKSKTLKMKVMASYAKQARSNLGVFLRHAMHSDASSRVSVGRLSFVAI